MEPVVDLIKHLASFPSVNVDYVLEPCLLIRVRGCTISSSVRYSCGRSSGLGLRRKRITVRKAVTGATNVRCAFSTAPAVSKRLGAAFNPRPRKCGFSTSQKRKKMGTRANTMASGWPCDLTRVWPNAFLPLSFSNFAAF